MSWSDPDHPEESGVAFALSEGEDVIAGVAMFHHIFDQDGDRVYAFGEKELSIMISRKVMQRLLEIG